MSLSALPDYPDLLAAAMHREEQAGLDLTAAKAVVEAHLTAFRDEAASDSSLTNETMRRAYVERRKIESHHFHEALTEEAAFRRAAIEAKVEYERTRRGYEVARLLFERGTAYVAAGLMPDGSALLAPHESAQAAPPPSTLHDAERLFY